MTSFVFLIRKAWAVGIVGILAIVLAGQFLPTCNEAYASVSASDPGVVTGSPGIWIGICITSADPSSLPSGTPTTRVWGSYNTGIKTGGGLHFAREGQ